MQTFCETNFNIIGAGLMQFQYESYFDEKFI